MTESKTESKIRPFVKTTRAIDPYVELNANDRIEITVETGKSYVLEVRSTNHKDQLSLEANGDYIGISYGGWSHHVSSAFGSIDRDTKSNSLMLYAYHASHFEDELDGSKFGKKNHREVKDGSVKIVSIHRTSPFLPVKLLSDPFTEIKNVEFLQVTVASGKTYIVKAVRISTTNVFVEIASGFLAFSGGLTDSLGSLTKDGYFEVNHREYLDFDLDGSMVRLMDNRQLTGPTKVKYVSVHIVKDAQEVQKNPTLVSKIEPKVEQIASEIVQMDTSNLNNLVF